MKRSSRGTLKEVCGGALALLLFALLAAFPARFGALVSRGISLWAVSVLPVTFPFLFLTLLLARMPLFGRLARRTSPVFSRLFRVSGAGGCAAVLSMFSGYPAGARAVVDLAEHGALPAGERMNTACLATTSGPAFLVGVLGTAAGTAAGWLLFAAHLIGVWSVCLWMGRRLPRPTPLPPVRRGAAGSLAESLFQAVLSVLAVGGAIALFYALGALLFDALAPLSLPQEVRAAAAGLIEMTSGCLLLLKAPSPLALALCAFLVTFGGMCVLVQEWSFLKRTGVRLAPFLCAKAAQGIVAALAAHLLAFLL